MKRSSEKALRPGPKPCTWVPKCSGHQLGSWRWATRRYAAGPWQGLEVSGSPKSLWRYMLEEMCLARTAEPGLAYGPYG